jgi:HEAT repeat protein
MLPSTQHEADERIARYLGRLAGGTAARKAQFFLDSVASAWQPELKSCFGGRTHWHVAPRAADLATVVDHAGAGRPLGVRLAAFSAIARAGEHARLGKQAVIEGLGDGERRVRLAASRAAADGELGDDVARELRNVLADDVWAVRWHAARGLVARAYDSELGSLARMLVSTTPRGGMSLTAWAQAVDAVRPRCRIAGQSAELDAHVTQTFATLSARDRDFAWPLWR